MTDNLALNLPENYERPAPHEIPSDLKRFMAWSHFACVEWPSELMIAAYHAIEAMKGATWRPNPSADIAEFKAMYAQWWALSEYEKIALMHDCQARSPSRDYYRRQARAALGLRR